MQQEAEVEVAEEAVAAAQRQHQLRFHQRFQESEALQEALSLAWEALRHSRAEREALSPLVEAACLEGWRLGAVGRAWTCTSQQ